MDFTGFFRLEKWYKKSRQVFGLTALLLHLLHFSLMVTATEGLAMFHFRHAAAHDAHRAHHGIHSAVAANLRSHSRFLLITFSIHI